MEVTVARRALKQIAKAPSQIRVKFRSWVMQIERRGVYEVRKQPGFHDEPLKGARAGQRSVRLNRQWRAIYVLQTDGDVELVSVEEVNPHEY